MNLGLKKTDLELIKKEISNFSEVDKAVIFGSRAKECSVSGSDVDIALCGDKVSFDTVSQTALYP